MPRARAGKEKDHATKEEEMKTDIKTEWLSALRSGEYPQGKYNLSNRGEFCCLGVLCEIAVKHGILDRFPSRSESGVVTYGKKGTVKEAHKLPDAVLKWAGIDDAWGEYSTDEYTVTLSGYNDYGKTFNEIADIIEEHF